MVTEREHEWTIVVVPCTDEEAQSILAKITSVDESNTICPNTYTYAYLDNFKNLNNLDFTTFLGRLVYKE